MILAHDGLEWDVPSPSFWRLLPRHTNGATLDISYLGDTWCLFLCRDGAVSTRAFANRDAAMQLVSNAFATF